MLGQMEACHSSGKHVDPTAAESLHRARKRDKQGPWCQTHEKVQAELWWQHQQSDHRVKRYNEGGKLSLELGPECPVEEGEAQRMFSNGHA